MTAAPPKDGLPAGLGPDGLGDAMAIDPAICAACPLAEGRRVAEFVGFPGATEYFDGVFRTAVIGEDGEGGFFATAMPMGKFMEVPRRDAEEAPALVEDCCFVIGVPAGAGLRQAELSPDLDDPLAQPARMRRVEEPVAPGEIRPGAEFAVTAGELSRLAGAGMRVWTNPRLAEFCPCYAEQFLAACNRAAEGDAATTAAPPEGTGRNEGHRPAEEIS